MTPEGILVGAILIGALAFGLLGLARRSGLFNPGGKPDCGCGSCNEKRKSGLRKKVFHED